MIFSSITSRTISVAAVTIFVLADIFLYVNLTSAADTVIDFEGLPCLAQVTSQYTGLGVTFTGATILTKPSCLNYQQFPPYSGVNVLYDEPNLDGVIVATFNSTAGNINKVSARVTGNRNVTLTAFNNAGVALVAAQTGGPNYVGAGTGIPVNLLLSVESSIAPIARVTFHDGGNTYTVDDFIFSATSPTQPPIISSFNQFKSDTATEIQEGKTTTESTVAFKAALSDPDNNKVKLRVELRQKDEPFTGIDDGGILNSDFVNSDSEVVITKDGLTDGRYHWRARAVDDKGSFSEWQEFGDIGNTDFIVKLVPLYTQIKSPYPSEPETDKWSKERLGNGGTGGFAEYRLSLVTPANYSLTINGKDDNAANGARATLSINLYKLPSAKDSFKVFRTMSWPSGDDAYKDISSDLGALSKGDYLLRLTSTVDYFDVKYNTTKDETYDLNVYLDWIKITNTTAPDSPEIKMEAEDRNYRTNLKGGSEEIEENKTIVKIYGYSCGGTIGDCGCAITSLAMLGRYYDIDKGIDSSAVNPGNLNNWLSDNNGYVANGGTWWGKSIEYLGYIENGKKKVRLNLDYHNEPSVSAIVDDDYINKNKPAIGQSKKFGHFIVVDGKIKFDTGVNDYTHTIKDPYWYNTRTLRETKNIANHIQDYKNYYDTANLFSYLETPKIIASSMWIYLASPAEFLITDPLGRKLGKDPITGIVYNEIPEGSYTSEYSIASSDEPIDPEQLHEIKAVYIPAPIDGKYMIQVIGTDNGSYTIDLLMYDQEGESRNLTLKGDTSLNNTQEYELDFSLENIQETEIYRIIEIDIKPGSFPNSINLKSKGVTTVAVLTDEFFDAKNIVIDSVLFAGAKPAKGKLEDVDNDGDLDLISHFSTQSLQLNLNDAEASLTGQLTNGNLIKGTDFVRIVNK